MHFVKSIYIYIYFNYLIFFIAHGGQLDNRANPPGPLLVLLRVFEEGEGFGHYLRNLVGPLKLGLSCWTYILVKCINFEQWGQEYMSNIRLVYIFLSLKV